MTFDAWLFCLLFTAAGVTLSAISFEHWRR